MEGKGRKASEEWRRSSQAAFYSGKIVKSEDIVVYVVLAAGAVAALELER